MYELKKCSKCNLNKELSKFSKNKNKKDGLSPVCKTCHKEYRHNHYLKNKTKVTKQVKEYRKNYQKKYEELKKIYPNITISCIKSNRIHPVSCCVCGKEYYKHKKDIKDKNICSSKCNSVLNFNPIEHYLQGVLKRSRKKSFECNLDSEYLEELFNKQHGLCGLSGVTIKLPNKDNSTKIYETASLDRINNNIGYIKGNVRWVVLGINYMKNRHSDKDVIILINKIKNFSQNILGS